MADFTPTHSALLELKDERRAMQEGYAFLDEKCLFLAAEILRELAQHGEASRSLQVAHDEAVSALRAAVARNGLEGLQIYPPATLEGVRVHATKRLLMGVVVQTVELLGQANAAVRAADRSPEAEECRRAFLLVLERAAAVGAHSGNLERLSLEYRRSVRRARALQDVLLPECDYHLRDLATRLEELEQEDAISMRGRAARYR